MNFYGFDKKKEEINQNDNNAQNRNNPSSKNVEQNKYASENVNEGYEQKLNNDIDKSEHERLINSAQKRIEYNMSEEKKHLTMKREDKQAMELMRRWSIKLYNVYVTPLEDGLNPFIQFTIGGDFAVEVLSNKKGQVKKNSKGHRGYVDKTEVQEDVQNLEKRPFVKIIDIEMRMTYAMIEKQKIMIELWDYHTLTMNSIMGYNTINLIDIVNGYMNVSVPMHKYEKNKKKKSKYNILKVSSCWFS